MFTVCFTLAAPHEPWDLVIPADSGAGRIITNTIFGCVDDPPAWLDYSSTGGPDFLLTALVYSQVFPKGRKGASVKEVSDLLGVSEDVVRSLLADGEIVGWKVRSRVIVSTDSVHDFLEANEWH